ncbi:hypothetical protein K474DRAFT_1658839 [Panus rudis PR-1116 ss-1]|nr:hypothetical protein K474DRAFT_1658839 [Panus rudis PR-1116 ss-1]
MAHHTIVATHLSPLYPPSDANTIVVPTKQGYAPLPSVSQESDLPLEHATYASMFDSIPTGPILFRVVHGGLVLELISLAHDVPSLRIVFPAPLLPHPSVFIWNQLELHVIAVTTAASLFRIVLPITHDGFLWQNAALSGRRWWREYVISKLHGVPTGTMVQGQGVHCVVISLPGGSLMRLEAKELGGENEDDIWEEHVFHHSSILNSLTSILNTSVPGAFDIVSLASLPQPTDIGHIWTLSRDRTLRLWSNAGCVASKTLPPSGITSSTLRKNQSQVHGLLDEFPQKLLRAIYPQGYDAPLVVVFIPSDSPSASGGVFHVLHTVREQLVTAQVISSSLASKQCHLQDFTVADDILYALWDNQGRSMVDWIKLSIDSRLKVDGEEQAWNTAEYPPEIELTPEYLDEPLVSPGSLTDRFLEATMRPGMFSDLTLRVALAQYTDACLSLPGPHPAPLLATYNSLGENIAAVVGCTVQLTQDAHSNTSQYDKYWIALKRDWEGFIARCREIERSSRWPLAIGVNRADAGIIVVERERLATVVDTDLPLQLQLKLSSSAPSTLQLSGRTDPPLTLLAILWDLRAKMDRRSILAVESRITDIIRQEIAFSYADVIQVEAQRLTFIDEGLDSWIMGRLQHVENLETSARFILDVIGGLERVPKAEEEESLETLETHSRPSWKKALVASYVASTVQARYDHCLSLAILLFLVSEDLPHWDPSLLAEILVVFRGIAILRHTIRRPAGEHGSKAASAEEDVVAGLRNMSVSSGRPRYAPSSSLIYCLLPRFMPSTGISSAGHVFLDTTGLLQSVSPAHVTQQEVTYCERLRLQGYLEVTRDILSWFPRTPSISYVLARLLLDEGRYEDAASSFESLGGVFGSESGLSYEDRDALEAVLPSGVAIASIASYYHHISALFKNAGVVTYEILFSQSALANAPTDTNTTSLWYTVVRGFIDLGMYHEAYNALASLPSEKLKRDCIPQLVYRMCEEHSVDRLMSFNFAGLVGEVEEALCFKARNADPRIRPFYSRILYTWYISRGDYRNAALTMYQRAKKLKVLQEALPQATDLITMQLEAYAVSINALSLLDAEDAWIAVPMASRSGHQIRKHAGVLMHIPEEKIAIGAKDTVIICLEEIRHEYVVLSMLLEVAHLDSRLLSIGDLPQSPALLLSKLVQGRRYDTAMAAARALNVDMNDVFAQLTSQCLKLTRNSGYLIDETTNWLLTDEVSSWSGTYIDRAWRYLRYSLRKYDGPQTDFAYSKTVLELLLASERSSAPPPWLIESLQEYQPEYLIRTFLRYDFIENALEHVLFVIHKDEGKKFQDDSSCPAFHAWLPYTLIDQVLLVADSSPDAQSSRIQRLVHDIRSTLSRRLDQDLNRAEAVRP